MKISITSKVIGGKLTRNRSALAKAIAHFEGKDVEIVVQKKKRTRSNQQNKWWWGVAVEIVYYAFIDIGLPKSKNQIHEILKKAAADEIPHIMLEEVVVPDTGVILSTVRSTTELTTSDFMELKAWVQRWASENLGVEIPDPNEQVEIFAE